MEKKIKAMLDVGMTDEQIMSILGLTEEEYLNALYDTEESVKTKTTSKTESKPDHDSLPRLSERLVNARGKSSTLSEEDFELAKELRKQGYFIREIAAHIGRSSGFMQGVLKCNTYDEVLAWRKNIKAYQRSLDNKKSKEAKKPKETNADRRANRKEAYTISKFKMPVAKIETISAELVELRTMNDYLARIVEVLENKPKKRGWFH